MGAIPQSGPTLNILCQELHYPLRSRNIKLQLIWMENEAETFENPKIGRYRHMEAVLKRGPIYSTFNTKHHRYNTNVCGKFQSYISKSASSVVISVADKTNKLKLTEFYADHEFV